MKAYTLDGFDAASGLRDDLPEPVANEGELVVAVKAPSVNPVDNVVIRGGLRNFASYVFPVTLGRDFAGVVERGAGEFADGDEVFGFLSPVGPDVHRGAWAERIVAPAGDLVGRRADTPTKGGAGAGPRPGAAGRRP